MYLISESDSHDRDEKSEQKFQFTQTVFIEKQKCKRIDNRNKSSDPKRHSEKFRKIIYHEAGCITDHTYKYNQYARFIRKKINSYSRSDNFLHVRTDDGDFNHDP